MSNLDNFEEQEAYERASARVKRIKGYYAHLTSYIIVNLFIITLIAINKDGNESFWRFETFATAFFWGIGLLFHTVGVFGKDLVFNKQWEDRKLKEYMDEERNNNTWK